MIPRDATVIKLGGKPGQTSKRFKSCESMIGTSFKLLEWHHYRDCCISILLVTAGSCQLNQIRCKVPHHSDAHSNRPPALQLCFRRHEHRRRQASESRALVPPSHSLLLIFMGILEDHNFNLYSTMNFLPS